MNTVNTVSKEKVVLAYSGGLEDVYKRQRHILVMGREGFAQGERGPAARRAEHDAASRECVNAFVNALGHGFVIGEQGEVHVGGDESDRGEVGIGEVRGKHVILSGLGGARLDVRRYCIA